MSDISIKTNEQNITPGGFYLLMGTNEIACNPL